MANSTLASPINWLVPDAPRPCLLCGSSDQQVLAHTMQHGLNLPTVICLQCGLVFTNPLPPATIYQGFYEHAYARYYDEIAIAPEGIYQSEMPSHIRAILDQLAAFMPLNGSHLAEVGPGKGLFLYWAQQSGCKVLGIEPATAFAAYLHERDLPCIHSSFEAVPRPDQPYDILVMLHVFEHFYDQNAVLEHCRALLRPDGLLVLAVPNILKPYRSLDHYFLRYVHPVNFSPATLKVLLAKHGFGILHCDDGEQRWHIPEQIFIIARKQADVPLTFPLPDQPAGAVIRVVQRYRWRWRLWQRQLWYSWHYGSKWGRRARKRLKGFL